MKKNITLLIIAVLAAWFMQACSFDAYDEQYPTKSVLFTYQSYNRQLVVGEGLEFKIGAVFSGMPENDRDRQIKYVVDPSLVGSGQTLLPADYYTEATPGQLVVAKGQLKGYGHVKLDSAKFVSDPKALTGEYVLPVRIVYADADTISPGKEFMILSLRYEGKQYGNYNYTGKRTDDSGNEETYANNPTATPSVRQLQTIAPNRFRLIADPNGAAGDPQSETYSLLLTAPVSGSGPVWIETDPDNFPEVTVEPDGESSYDASARTFVLKYKYTVKGVSWHAAETLVFRNRIRDDQGDGRYLNEWR